MFTDAEKDLLLDLRRRAAEHPVDMRDLLNPGKVRAFREQMANQSAEIGRLVIAFGHERMPPNWGIYRHLSVSENGKPVNEQVFLEIAKIMGMGDTNTWSHDLMRVISRMLPLAARHALQPILD
jgi:hypothetical protein